MKIYVGNLPFTTTDADLQTMFSTHGEVTDAVVITDRETGRSRGFGFVEMKEDGAGTTAIGAMDGHDIDGRALKVNEARPKADRGGGGGR